MKQSQDIDVAITYAWNRVAYNVLRNLSLKGLEVAVGDTSAVAMAKKSKHCHYAFSHPSFYRDPKGFIESLKSTFYQLNPKVYFPIHEEIFVVSKYIEEFKDMGVQIPIHNFETLKSVHKKDLLNGIATKLGIPAPVTYKPKDLSELRSIWNDIGSKGRVVLKMLNTTSAKGVFHLTSYEDLIKTYSSVIGIGNMAVENYPIIQEYVGGEGYGVSLLYNKGKKRAKFTHKRLREKIATGGTSTKRVSVKNPVIEEYAEHLLTSLKWHGVAMAEFRFDESSGKGWLIDVNPRFWGSLALAIHAGVDFPYLLYKMAVDGDIEPVTDYREGVIVRWILGDVVAAMSYMKAKKSLRPIMEFFSFKGEKYDDLYKDDLMPFFTECMYYFKKVVAAGSTNPVDEALLDVDNI